MARMIDCWRCHEKKIENGEVAKRNQGFCSDCAAEIVQDYQDGKLIAELGMPENSCLNRAEILSAFANCDLVSRKDFRREAMMEAAAYSEGFGEEDIEENWRPEDEECDEDEGHVARDSRGFIAREPTEEEKREYFGENGDRDLDDEDD